MLEFHTNQPTTGSPASSMLSLLNLNSLAAGSMDAMSRSGGGGSGVGSSPGGGFVLGSPPLAALHTMTEMKSAMLQHYSSPTHSSQKSPHSHPPHSVHSPLSSSSTTSTPSANPHGIDHILSRSSEKLAAAAAGGGGNNLNRLPPPLSLSLAQLGSNGWMGALGKQMELGRGGIYWPGFQSLVGNTHLWRERLNHSGNGSNSDKDGKKKHTRPTFSGQQIFALEKTFENTKYLAGPERAKLAYALQMTESQVKVWFQNRRTKWRKKHAAEMATAKRKQEEAEGMCEDESSEVEDCDEDELLESDIHSSPFHHIKKSKYHHQHSSSSSLLHH